MTQVGFRIEFSDDRNTNFEANIEDVRKVKPEDDTYKIGLIDYTSELTRIPSRVQKLSQLHGTPTTKVQDERRPSNSQELNK